MKKGILSFCLLLLIIGVQAQESKEFKKVWNKKMSQKDILDKQEEFLRDLKTYFYYKHDSVDFKLFVGPNKRAWHLSMAVVGVEAMQHKLDKKEYVFRMIDSIFLEFKKTDDYLIVRKKVLASETLQHRIVDVKNWETDHKLLELLGCNPMQLEEIRVLVESNTGKEIKYIEMLQKYFTEKKKNTDAVKKSIDLDKYWVLSAECTAYVDDIDTVSMIAKEANKPILLFFSSYGKMEAIEMSMELVRHPEVTKYIGEHYIFAVLYMDSKTLIPKEKRYVSDVLGDEVKFKGDVNMEFQKKKFQMQQYPLLMIVTPDMKEIARMNTTTDMDKFLKFLIRE